MKSEQSFVTSSREVLVWAIAVLRRILRISPYRLLGSVVLSLVAQVSMVLSFFLPLKVIFLLGARDVPSYFSAVLPDASLTDLIGVLVFLAAVFYFIFLGANHYSEQLSSAGASKVIDATSKLPLFTNQNEIAFRSYLRIGNLLAATLFLTSTLAIFSAFYLQLFLIFSACLVGSFLIVSGLFRLRTDFFLRAKQLPGPFISQVYGILFLVVFSFMVFDLLHENNVNVYVALACLLLVRQLLQRLTTATLDVVLLARQTDKISALFFTNSKCLHDLRDNEKSINKLYSSASMSGVVGDISNLVIEPELSVGSLDPSDISFIQSSLVDVVLISVNFDHQSFLIKVFDDRHQLLAERENDLVCGMGQGQLLGRFHAIGQVIGFRAHVYKFEHELMPNEDTEFKERRDFFRVECFKNPPQKEVVDRYFLSHVSLADRLNDLAELLGSPILAESMGEWTVDGLLGVSAKVIRTLPLRLCTPDVTTDSLRELGNHTVVCLHWERWSIDLLGFGLSLPELELAHLKKLLSEAGLGEVDVRLVRLCGLFGVLEGQLKNQKLASARETLSTITKSVEALDFGAE